MGDLQNELSWSPSRGRRLKDCARAYFYKHYGSWNGWDRNGTPEQRLAYRLKQMKGMHAWIGQIVHDVIEAAMRAAERNREVPDAKELQERARFTLNQQWFESKDKAWEERPKQYANLFDHYYGREISKPFLDSLKQKAFDSLANFRASDVLREIMECDEWMGMEKLMSFQEAGVKCYAKPDFATRPHDVVIYDWKTGKPNPKDDFQVATYAVLAKRLWNATNTEVVLFYLPSNHVVRRTPDADELASVERQIQTDVDFMKRQLRDPEKNEAAKEDFPLCHNKRMCSRCEYFELCEDELNPKAPVEDDAEHNLDF